VSTLQELREDARRDAAYEEMESEMPDPCECGCPSWRCIGTDRSYGADADGRRGGLLREWECCGCGSVVELVYG